MNKRCYLCAENDDDGKKSTQPASVVVRRAKKNSNRRLRMKMNARTDKGNSNYSIRACLYGCFLFFSDGPNYYYLPLVARLHHPSRQQGVRCGSQLIGANAKLSSGQRLRRMEEEEEGDH